MILYFFVNTILIISFLLYRKKYGISFLIRTKDRKHILYTWGNKYSIKQDIPLFIDYLGYYLNDCGEITFTKNQLIDNITNSIYMYMPAYTKHKWSASYLNSILAKIDPKLFSNNLKNL